MISKKQIIIIASFATLLLAGGLLLHYYSSFHTLKVTLNSEVKEITISKLNGSNLEIVETLKKSDTIRLTEGKYSIAPTDDKFSDNPITFSIPATSTIEINPDYSDTYLAKLADDEINDVKTALNAAFQEPMQMFSVNNFQLLKKGQWMGVVLVPSEFDFQNPNSVHRALLKKEDNSWSVVGFPQPALTKYTTPNVPIEVLTRVNDITYEED